MSVMFQHQLVVCLFMGFQLSAINNILNAYPITKEIESSDELYTDIDQSIESESLGEIVLDLSYLDSSYIGVPDDSMNERLLKAQRETEEMGRDFNPEEYGTYLEGDLLMPIDEAKSLLRGSKRDYHDQKATLWPNGIVPYKIDREFSKKEINQIHKAMEDYHANTCIRFRKHTVEKDYVFIAGREAGCHSHIGRSGGRQTINLHRPFCLTTVSTIQHEMMHAIGFLHEQSRYDRDEHVQIVWDNIKKGHEFNFVKTKNKKYSEGFIYDYRSIMHYGAYYFAIDHNKPTIKALDPTKQKLIGNRFYFSPDDLIKINTRYRCKVLEATHNDDDDVGLFFEFHSGNVSIDIDYNADEIDY